MKSYEAKLYLMANDIIDISNLFCFNTHPVYIIFGKVEELDILISNNEERIEHYYLEINYRNKLLDYYDLKNTKARIEVGSVIRSGVNLSDKAIVLMGAIINTNSTIGDYTMIDMNAVIGSGAVIGKNCHIGAGAVIAGVMEPISNSGVVILDNVLIGANATILSGVKIGKNAIVGAGSVVCNDVEEFSTVAGVPAKVINHNQDWKMNRKLR